MTLNVEALNEVGRVFDWRPDPARYFANSATEQVRLNLQTHLLTHQDGVLVLEGEAGSGKTMLVNILVQALPAHWAHIARLNFTVMSGDEIASTVAYAFGMPHGASVMSHQLPQEWIETQLHIWANCGEASLLVVDEAHNLPHDALQAVLALSQLRVLDRPALRLLLVGQPGFLAWRNAAEPPQEWAQGLARYAAHIGPSFCMPTLTEAESTAYLQQRLNQYVGPALPELTASAIAEIHTRTQGCPGRINVLCQQLLHSAILLESRAPIDAAAVALQADELLFHAAPNVPPPVPVPPVAAVPPIPEPAAERLAKAPALPPSAPSASPPQKAPAQVSSQVPVADTTPPHLALISTQKPRPPTPSSPPHMVRLAHRSASFIAIALVVAATWFYAPLPIAPTVPTGKSAPPVAAAVPAPITPAPIAATPTPTVATETLETPDPETQALLTTPMVPVAPVAPPTTTPTAVPEELPHAPPVAATPTTPTTTTASSTPATPPEAIPAIPAIPAISAKTASLAPRAVPNQAAPTTMVTAVTTAADRPAAKATNTRCTSLLTQISLGEPINTQQRRVLETQCRQTK